MKKLNLFKYLLSFFVLLVMSGCDSTRSNYPISFSENYEQFLKNRPANFKRPIPNLDVKVTVAPTKDSLKIKNKIGTYFWYNETYDFISKKHKISLEIDQIISNFFLKRGYEKKKGKWIKNKHSMNKLRTPFALSITIKKLKFLGQEDIPYDIINGSVSLELSLAIKKKKKIEKVNIESKLQIQGDHPVPHIADRIRTVIRQSILEGLEKLFSKI